ncbi:MAG: PEP-CTERM sorting domain-containing protein [Planctomycetales bacterium]|nr:PEP-CTERM sorting domain-containing protein [Planctomycetales bacterium]
MPHVRSGLSIVAVLVFLASSAKATNVEWTGSGASGTDPLGHGWVLSNNGPGGNAVVGIPGNGLGGTPFLGPLGDFVTDFHFHTDDANIVATETGTTPSLSTLAHVEGANPLVWDRQLMGSNTAWFFAPNGTRLDSGEVFFWNIVLDRPLSAISFTAGWTMVPEPTTLTLTALGLMSVLCRRRRR